MNGVNDERIHAVSPALALALAAVVLPAVAVAESGPGGARASRAESAGVASGLVLGAAAAGPFGAVLGAATGAWLGDRYHLARESARSATSLQHRVGFRTGSAELEPDAVEQLRRLAKVAAGCSVTRVRIVGEADPRGDEAYNLALSQRRAEAVASVFAEQGWPRSRLFVAGLGAVQTVAGAPPDPDGYAFARRVTVSFEGR